MHDTYDVESAGALSNQRDSDLKLQSSCEEEELQLPLPISKGSFTVPPPRPQESQPQPGSAVTGVEVRAELVYMRSSYVPAEPLYVSRN